MRDTFVIGVACVLLVACAGEHAAEDMRDRDGAVRDAASGGNGNTSGTGGLLGSSGAGGKVPVGAGGSAAAGGTSGAGGTSDAGGTDAGDGRVVSSMFEPSMSATTGFS